MIIQNRRTRPPRKFTHRDPLQELRKKKSVGGEVIGPNFVVYTHQSRMEATQLNMLNSYKNYVEINLVVSLSECPTPNTDGAAVQWPW